MSSQTIARYGPDGAEVFKRTYRPAGPSRWARLLLVTIGAASGAVDFSQAIYGHYLASANTERFYYIYFEDRDGDDAHRFGLVRIDKTTGDETGRLWINQRNPEYLLGPATRSLFYKESDTVIRAVRF